MSREVTWDGKKYPSIAAAARAEGCPDWQMRYWLDLPDTGRSSPVSIRGVEYTNAYAAAAALGVCVEAIWAARRRGSLDRVGLRSGRRKS